MTTHVTTMRNALTQNRRIRVCVTLDTLEMGFSVTVSLYCNIKKYKFNL